LSCGEGARAVVSVSFKGTTSQADTALSRSQAISHIPVESLLVHSCAPLRSLALRSLAPHGRGERGPRIRHRCGRLSTGWSGTWQRRWTCGRWGCCWSEGRRRWLAAAAKAGRLGGGTRPAAGVAGDGLSGGVAAVSAGAAANAGAGALCGAGAAASATAVVEAGVSAARGARSPVQPVF
jgi:hypothetical protein